MALLYRGKPFASHRELMALVKRDPDPICGFRVKATYGTSDDEGLHYERFGGLAESDGPALAPEHTLINLLQCVGSDYIEFAEGLGLDLRAVTIEIEGEYDARPSFIPLGLKPPAGARAGYKQLRVNVTAHTSASKATVEKVHQVLWETNILADTFRAVPVRTTVQVAK